MLDTAIPLTLTLQSKRLSFPALCWWHGKLAILCDFGKITFRAPTRSHRAAVLYRSQVVGIGGEHLKARESACASVWCLVLVLIGASFVHRYRSNMSSRVQKMMVQPINLIFTFLQKKTRVEIWLYDNAKTRLEGRIIVRLRFDIFFKLFFLMTMRPISAQNI
jgi:hypothetical protein